MPHTDKKVDWIYMILYHILVVVGVIMLAMGASDLQKANPRPNDQTLIKAGISILTVAWLALVGWSGATLLSNNHRTKSGAVHRDGTLVRIPDHQQIAPHR